MRFLNFSRTNVDELVDDILQEEPLIPVTKKHYLVSLIDSKLDLRAQRLT